MGVERAGVRPGRSSHTDSGVRMGPSGSVAAQCRQEVGDDLDRRGPDASGREKGKERWAGGINWAGRELGRGREFGLR
jgi:hypothetical protein